MSLREVSNVRFTLNAAVAPACGRSRGRIAGVLRAGAFFGATFACATSGATPQPMINYFKPIPIVGQLAATGWGSVVGPRDPENGLEDPSNYFYWDGKIIKASDGVYHMFASRWPASGGVSGWEGFSKSAHATSSNVIGPYTSANDTYSYMSGTGHNTTAIALADGTYGVIESAIVPGWLFTSSSLDGTFNYQTSINWNANGTGLNTQTFNLQINIGEDGAYWGICSPGFVGRSTTFTGTYTALGPSVYPTIPGRNQNNAEDPVIWYSGGFYHVVYDY